MSTELLSTSYSMVHKISHVVSGHFLIHSHPFYELYYFLRGDARFLYDGMEYVMQPHTLIVIAPNVFHGINVLTDQPYERLTFHFTEEIISKEHRRLLMGNLPTEETIRKGTNPVPYIISGADSMGCLPLMLDAERLIGMPQEVCDAMARVILEALLGILLIHEGDLHSSAQYLSRYSDDKELQPILSYIHQNLTEKITLDDLCQYAGFSKSKMNQLFRAHLGTTTMEYVIRRRLHYAQQLLINGYSTAQACKASGFADYTNFYRAYIKQMGRAPMEDKRKTGENGLRLPLEEMTAARPEKREEKRNGEEKPSIWTLYRGTNISSPVVLTDPGDKV